MMQIVEPTAVQTPSPTHEAAYAVQGGAASMADVERRLAPYFERAEPRRRVMAYVRGMLSPAACRNSWQVAEVSSDATPDGVQHLLRRALWTPEAVCDERCTYIIEHLGIRTRCWALTRPAFRKRAARPPAWHGNTAGQRAASTTARSACLWPMRVGTGTHCWIGSSSCPRRGLMISGATARPEFRKGDASRPSHSWPKRGGCVCWPRACRPGG
jgi:hypothetical protein